MPDALALCFTAFDTTHKLWSAKEMITRLSHHPSRCIPPQSSHRLLSLPGTCARLPARKFVKKSLISVVTRCTAEQSEDNSPAKSAEQTSSSSTERAQQMSAAEGCLRFINYAWTQFHAVGKFYVFVRKPSLVASFVYA